MASTLARSNGTKFSTPESKDAMALVSSSLSLRPSAKTRKPSDASFRATARPTPRVPPLIRTLSIAAQLSAGRQFQRRHKAQHGRDLEGRQFFPAGFQDGLLESGIVVGDIA